MASRQGSSKIYIKRGDTSFSFMWAKTYRDGSVYMGFGFKGDGGIELVVDEACGEVRPPALVTRESIDDPKISFHPSGTFKLTAWMGRSAKSIDRATVTGPPLSEIVEPRRMAEILIPKCLPKAQGAPTDRDIVLDATSAPRTPLRCTISCVARGRLDEIPPHIPFVETSAWETACALDNGSHAWVWTLRVAREDTLYPDRIHLFLIGPVRWGQPT